MSVVVGVSPTTGSPTALRWGREEARLRGLPLRAVLAWRPPRPPAASGGRPPLAAGSALDPQTEADELVRSLVVDALGSADGVDCRAVKGSAVSALLAASEGAHVLVIGEPRPGRVGTVRTGLVAPQVVMRSRCAVVVMPNVAVVPV